MNAGQNVCRSKIYEETKKIAGIQSNLIGFLCGRISTFYCSTYEWMQRLICDLYRAARADQ